MKLSNIYMIEDIVSMVVIILLFIVICYSTYLHIKTYLKIKDLKEELNKQDLDYHLKKIEQLGYDFTIKAGNNKSKVKSKKSSSPKRASLSSSKKIKSKSFSDLLPKKK